AADGPGNRDERLSETAGANASGLCRFAPTSCGPLLCMTASKSVRISARISIPRAEFTFSFVRSSGPGGQNVNKVNSKAQLRWNVVGSPALPEDVRQRLVSRYARRITDRGELVL